MAAEESDSNNSNLDCYSLNSYSAPSSNLSSPGANGNGLNGNHVHFLKDTDFEDEELSRNPTGGSKPRRINYFRTARMSSYDSRPLQIPGGGIPESDDEAQDSCHPGAHLQGTPPVIRHPLSCAICGEKFNNPKVLPCLHTFCERCLIAYLPPESLTLTCPECRQQSILPEEGIPALQTNFCVTNLQSMDKDETDPSEDEKQQSSTQLKPKPRKRHIRIQPRTCSECKSTKATLRCHDCEWDMCEPCSKSHPKIDLSKPQVPSKLKADNKNKRNHRISRLHADDDNQDNSSTTTSSSGSTRTTTSSGCSSSNNNNNSDSKNNKHNGGGGGGGAESEDKPVNGDTIESCTDEGLSGIVFKKMVMHKSGTGSTPATTRTATLARSNGHSNNNNKTHHSSDEEPQYLYCPKHSGQTLRFFCRDCDTAVCSSCTDIEHGRHVTVRAMDAVVDEKVYLKQLLESVHEKVESLQDGVSQTEKSMCLLSERKSAALKEINAVFAQLVEKLKIRQHELLDDVDTQFVEKIDQIQKTKSLIATHLKDVNDCCLLTEKALSHENATEILFVKKQIGERLEDYSKLDMATFTAQTGSFIDDSLEFDKTALERIDVSDLGRIVSSLHKSWAISGEVVQSRCVPIGRRHFLRLHMSATLAPHIDLHMEDIQVSSSVKEVVYCLEQPRESDNRSFIIRFLVSRVGSFNLSVLVKGHHIIGSPFQFHAFDAEDPRPNSYSPVPYVNGTHSGPGSTLHSPTGNTYNYSRIPRSNGASVSPRSRVSTPTRKYFSNGCLGVSTRRSNTLEDDLILKIGSRGRNRGEFTNPQGVASTSNGRLVVTDSNNQCVQIFDNTGECKLRFGSRGRNVGQLQRPVGVAILPTNGNIVIADYDNKWISIFDQTGKFMSRIGHGKLLGPKGITTDANGLIYVVDNKASCIIIFQPNGKIVNKFGSRGNDEGQFAGPHFIAVNSKGHMIISDFHNHCIKVFDSEGDYLYCFGTNGESNGQFNAPTGVAVDKDDNIIVADWGNSRIQVFDSQGTFQSCVSTAVEPLYGPQGLIVTSDGYIAIADSGNHCIKLYKHS